MTTVQKNIKSEREKLIEECLPLVKRIVNRLKHLFHVGEISEEDLIGYGTVGMIEAIDKYDQAKGNINAFITPRIKGAIYDHLRKIDHLKRSARSKSKKINQVISLLEQKLGRIPENHEIAECLDISVAELVKIQQDISVNFVSLDSSMGGENEEEYSNVICDPSLTPDEACEHKMMMEDIQKHLQALPEKERTIITLYHYKKLNMKEIAKILEISESRVCQLHHRGITLLKNQLGKIYF